MRTYGLFDKRDEIKKSLKGDVVGSVLEAMARFHYGFCCAKYSTCYDEVNLGDCPPSHARTI